MSAPHVTIGGVTVNLQNSPRSTDATPKGPQNLFRASGGDHLVLLAIDHPRPRSRILRSYAGPFIVFGLILTVAVIIVTRHRSAC